jgi:predicted N-acetyltransferase YhbS
LEAAKAAGHCIVLLVGDAPYYARFGFNPVPKGKLDMPGPVDPARLLAAELVPGALERAAGRVLAFRE